MIAGQANVEINIITFFSPLLQQPILLVVTTIYFIYCGGSVTIDSFTSKHLATHIGGIV